MQRVRLPPRPLARPEGAHKASVGRVLVVGGSRDMAGAPALAALGALRAGAGLVRTAVPRSIQHVVSGFRPESLTAGLAERADGTLAGSALPRVLDLALSADAVVLGCGAGRTAPTVRLMLDLPRVLPLPRDRTRTGRRL